MTADTFCGSPPIGTDVAFDVDLARHRHIEAAQQIALGELVDQRERERQPRRRPADAVGVDLDLERQLDSGRVERDEPDDRALGIVGRGDQRDLDRGGSLALALDLEGDHIARLVVGELFDEGVDGRHLHAVNARDLVAWLQRVRRWGELRALVAFAFEAYQLEHHDVAGYQLGVLVAQLPERDVLSDLRGRAHHLQRESPLLGRCRPPELLELGEADDLRFRPTDPRGQHRLSRLGNRHEVHVALAVAVDLDLVGDLAERHPLGDRLGGGRHSGVGRLLQDVDGRVGL